MKNYCFLDFDLLLELLLILLHFGNNEEDYYKLQYEMEKRKKENINYCEQDIIRGAESIYNKNVNLPAVSKSFKITPHTNYIMKIPVILAEKNIQFNLEPVYDFEEPVLEIKNVKEQVYLLETNLIMVTKDYSKPVKGKLFVKGFVRKSIEYASLSEQNKNYVIGTMKNLILNIPFQFTSMIEFDIPPTNSNNLCYEPISCDIGSQHIYGTQIYDSTEKLEKNIPINIFKRVQEKMVINLDVKILQKQYVN